MLIGRMKMKKHDSSVEYNVLSVLQSKNDDTKTDYVNTQDTITDVSK